MPQPPERTRVVPRRRRPSDPGTPRSECLVEIYGDRLGRRIVLDRGPLVIGRAIDADIAIHSDVVSRRHAVIEQRAAGWVVLDQDSTNGTWVNDRAIHEALLESGDLLQVGDTIFKYLAGNQIESLYFEEIYRMMVYDGLTGVHNRRYLGEFLEREFSRARRHGRNLSAIFVDLDNFKEINDVFGHLAGDMVLKQVARTFQDRIRREEIVARYGGDEFVVVIPESSPEEVSRFARILKERIEGLNLRIDDHVIPATVSVGVAHMSPDMESPDDLLGCADRHLFDAKRAGKNRVVERDEPDAAPPADELS